MTGPTSSKGTISIQGGQYVPEKPKSRKLFKWHKATIKTNIAEFQTVQKFVFQCVQHLPRYIQKSLLENFVDRFNSSTANNAIRSANIGIREESKLFQKIVRLSPFDNKYALQRDQVLENEAVQMADNCKKMIASASVSGEYEDKLYAVGEMLFSFVENKGIEAPVKQKSVAGVESALLRLQDEKWWLRKLRRAKDQTNEYLAIAFGIVGKKKNEYCTNSCAREYRLQQQANWDFLASMELVNEETNEVFNLKEIAEATAANPDNRRVELFVRIRGLEGIANELDYSAHFLTVTAPSKYHKNSKKWNGSRPDETQAYLCKQWAKARAKLNRMGVNWFGVRVAEPHADATPHWHMLIFTKKHDACRVKATIRGYALEHDADEKGAQKNRFDCEDIDTSKGSATGYIAKYIAKNINAKNIELEPDYDGSGSLLDAAQRVVAWASRWRIRQFQFFGAERISVWREFRRMKTPLENPTFEKIRLAADAGNWAEFTRLARPHDISFSKEDNGTNEYNEAVTVVTGLVIDGLEVITRTARWLVRKVSAAIKSNDSCATWSTVNNCTGVNEGGSPTSADIDSKISISFRDNVRNALQRLGLDTSATDILLNGGKVYSGNRGFMVRGGCLREYAAN